MLRAPVLATALTVALTRCAACGPDSGTDAAAADRATPTDAATATDAVGRDGSAGVDAAIAGDGADVTDASGSELGPDAMVPDVLVPDASATDAGPTEPCAQLTAAERRLALDGTWSAALRRRTPGQAWGAAQDLGSVSVPGWYFAFDRFPDADEDVELRYSRALTWPDAWSCAGSETGFAALLEFDSADYYAEVFVDAARLGDHFGYLGRFALDLPWATAGTLSVRLVDGVRDVDSRGGMEAYPAPTLQGADTGGWGINPVGLPGSVGLRLVRGAYLQNLYAAALDVGASSSQVRVGLQVRWLTAASAAVADLEIRDDQGAVLLQQRAALTPGAGGSTTASFVELSVPRGGAGPGQDPPPLTVTARVLADGQLADLRSAPLRLRRVALGANTLTLDGAPHFARGGAVHHLYRLLPFAAGYTPGTYVAVDEVLRQSYRDALLQARELGLGWLRPAHLVPDPAFFDALLAQGLLVYLDFPLHWNTDFGALPPAEIQRQFREFLWRAAAEPAVAIVAAHNEAEFGENSASDLQTVQTLLSDLLAIAAEVAPHLLVLGCSGCQATAQFAGNASYPVPDVVSDIHSYFGSWWQPVDGYADLGARVASLPHPSLPTLWSEMGNGWTRHYVYLAALDDVLEPAQPPELVALRAELEGWLRAPDGTPLTLRQFYAGVYCADDLQRPPSELAACIAEQVSLRSDPQIIAWARGRYVADRAAVEGDPADPLVQGSLVAAHYLAAQFFESRWQWALGERLLGVFSWERAENGFPFAAAGATIPAPAVARGRAIVRDASGAVSASLRPAPAGEVELRVVSDRGPRSIELNLRAGASALWSAQRTLQAASATTLHVPASALAGQAGQVLVLEVVEASALLTTAALRHAP